MAGAGLNQPAPMTSDPVTRQVLTSSMLSLFPEHPDGVRIGRYGRWRSSEGGRPDGSTDRIHSHTKSEEDDGQMAVRMPTNGSSWPQPPTPCESSWVGLGYRISKAAIAASSAAGVEALSSNETRTHRAIAQYSIVLCPYHTHHHGRRWYCIRRAISSGPSNMRACPCPLNQSPSQP